MDKNRFKNFILSHAKTFKACTYNGVTNQWQIFTTYTDAIEWLSSRPEEVKRIEISSKKGVFYSDQFCDIEELEKMAQEHGSAYAVRTWYRFSKSVF
ncbi:hypothetical protein [Abiotrophia defectiva]|uniref:hypothetical protein n=1 Tax=Abiotrophia defectiva TaxID=46125 RepID=UPI0028D6BC9D|nr:hypothetical protein [Abiotrophia defectiva]